jgi:ribosomal protein S27E
MASTPASMDGRASCTAKKWQNVYVRHMPEETPLYPIIEEHAPRFFAELREQGASLPRFVEAEFEHYLRCGRLEAGFIRVKCTGCRHEHLVAFSCKRRGWCPSCGARRMVETAAHLVDNVLPAVPVRQWVLSFPWPLRFLFATDPALLARVLGIVIRALSTFLVHRAGLRVGSGAKTGVVTLIQRFGSALNLNVHLHLLALDGAYSFEHKRARFHRTPAPSQAELERLLSTLIRRITRTLLRSGALIEDVEETYLNVDEGGTLEQLNAASVRYRIAVGPQAGRRTLTLRTLGPDTRDPSRSKPFTAGRDGFSLNASVACEPSQTTTLERLCRYIARPPIVNERLSTNRAGQVVYELKHPFRDGTTHVVFEPLDFIARLAALVPRPRVNLTRYHGLFAPRARHRQQVVPSPAAFTATGSTHQGDEPERAPVPPPHPRAPMTWMQRLKRVFDIDLSECPLCGAPMRVIAEITDPKVIAQILGHIAAREAGEGTARDPPLASAARH